MINIIFIVISLLLLVMNIYFAFEKGVNRPLAIGASIYIFLGIIYLIYLTTKG